MLTFKQFIQEHKFDRWDKSGIIKNSNIRTFLIKLAKKCYIYHKNTRLKKYIPLSMNTLIKNKNEQHIIDYYYWPNMNGSYAITYNERNTFPKFVPLLSKNNTNDIAIVSSDGSSLNSISYFYEVLLHETAHIFQDFKYDINKSKKEINDMINIFNLYDIDNSNSDIAAQANHDAWYHSKASYASKTPSEFGAHITSYISILKYSNPIKLNKIKELIYNDPLNLPDYIINNYKKVPRMGLVLKYMSKHYPTRYKTFIKVLKRNLK